MKILLVHNSYQKYGGEDVVVADELRQLQARGQSVVLYSRHNAEISRSGLISDAASAIWSRKTFRDVENQIHAFRPDVIHIHNTFPLISPSIYWAASKLRVPTVQTLHNFRVNCLNALYLREGVVCEDCVGKLPWRGVTRACYRGSRAASVVLASTLSAHRSIGTFQRKISRYIALSEFSRKKFIEGGLPAKRIIVKPNFVERVDSSSMSEQASAIQLLFVGRLSEEKGVQTLSKAMSMCSPIKLRVVGEGPLLSILQGIPNVEAIGHLSNDSVRQQMSIAAALVVPSICYENFPRSIVEAFSCGLPVIASRIGSLPEIVRDGETGLLFDPGNPNDLAAKMTWAINNPDVLRLMSINAKREYERLYTPERNYHLLMQIYQSAIDDDVENAA